MTQQTATVDHVRELATKKRHKRDQRRPVVIPPGAHATRDGNITRLVLPYPPSSNDYWRTAKGHTYLSSMARDYKKAVEKICEGCQPFRGPVRLTALVYRPVRRGDLTNRCKVLEDSLQAIAYIDDKQIVKAVYELFDDTGNPRVEVEVVSLGKVEGLLFGDVVDTAPKKKRRIKDK
jgi:Holliday junction resolvase RusA-like endonuclease